MTNIERGSLWAKSARDGMHIATVHHTGRRHTVARSAFEKAWQPVKTSGTGKLPSDFYKVASGEKAPR